MMSTRQIFFQLLAVAFVVLSSCSDSSETKFTEGSSIDELANRYLELNRYGGGILVAKGDDILYHKYFGMANYGKEEAFTEETAFKIGSVSELITTAIIQDLAKAGKINLDEKISQYIPELQVDFTVNEILNHKVKLPNIRAVAQQHPTQAYHTVNFINLGQSMPLKISNSDLAFNLLGTLIEKVNGKTFQESLHDYGKANGLSNTFFEQGINPLATGYLYQKSQDQLRLVLAPSYDDGMAFSSRGIKSTPSDLYKFFKALPEKEIFRNGYIANDGFSFTISKKEDLIIVILSNRRHPVGTEMVSSIESILAGQNYQLPLLRTPISSVPSEKLEAYSGTYALNRQMQFRVSVENDSLFVFLGPDKTHLIPQSENQFYMEQNDAAMRFLTDSTGQVNKVMLLDGFLTGNTAKRVMEE